MIAVARPDDVLDAAAVSAAVDESPALWLSNSLQWAYLVGSVVGAGWADYARVFHPAWREIEGGPTPVSSNTSRIPRLMLAVPIRGQA